MNGFMDTRNCSALYVFLNSYQKYNTWPDNGVRSFSPYSCLCSLDVPPEGDWNPYCGNPNPKQLLKHTCVVENSFLSYCVRF